jgi:uncharacterized protein (DUF2126 family)
LHPTIPVHAPLVFAIIDRWKERSIGGCTYHAAPPDGRIYTTRPADAAEAKERRTARFEVSGATPGAVAIPVEESNPNFPMTLDLRLPAPGLATHWERPGLTP